MRKNRDSSIKITKNSFKPKALQKFQAREWRKMDAEHFGIGNYFKQKKFQCVAYAADGKIQGVIIVNTAGRVACAKELIVGEKYRGQGIGKALLQAAEKIARKKGCTKLWLDTGAAWEAAKFYKALGYIITGRHKQHYFGQDFVIFTKWL